MNRKKVIYTICVEDVYKVAEQELGRDLTEIEASRISENIGDYFDWYDSITNAITDYFNSKK